MNLSLPSGKTLLRVTLVTALLICGFTMPIARGADAADARWYVMRNQGVKVGWMRLSTRTDGGMVRMDDEVHFAAKGQAGDFHHRMRSRPDLQLTPQHFSLDIARPRKPWALEADVAAKTMTVIRHSGLPARKSAPIPSDFATEFSAMRLAGRLKPGETRKVSLLGVWEKPTVVAGELRHMGNEALNLDGKTLQAARYVLSNPESADRVYWLDARQQLVKVQVFGRIEFVLTDRRSAQAADKSPRVERRLAAVAEEAVPARVRGPLTASALPAFVGAAGFGARTVGGRGGRVIAVTTLADDGPGSLRAALTAQGPRIVVFRVSGTIALSRSLEIHAPHVTVAGHSAPGGGILLRNAGLVIATDDVVLRYLRIRPGNHGRIDPEHNDALQINGARNVVVDHLSLSWSEDEMVQIWDAAQDVTLSWCLFGEALNKSRHPKGRHGAGVLIGNGSERVSLHHSLLANLDFRNPLVKDAGAVDIVENLVYNWGRTGGEVVDDIGREAHLNVVGNLYLAGPASRVPAFVVNKGDTAHSVYPKIFATNNIGPEAVAQGNRQFRMFSLGWDRQAVPRALHASQAFASPAVPRIGSATLQATILAQAGATRPLRDTVDSRIIEGVRSNSGNIIDSPTEVGGYPRIAAASAPPDSDHDGMSDAWEVGAGLDASNAVDAGADRDGDGYTNIEEYLESLLAP